MKKSLLAPTVAAAAAVLLAVPGQAEGQARPISAERARVRAALQAQPQISAEEARTNSANRTFETCFVRNDMRNQVESMNSMVDDEISKLRSEGTYEHEAAMRRAAVQNVRSAIQDNDPATIEKLNELIIQLGIDCFKQDTSNFSVPVSINGVTRDPETGEVTHGGFEFGEKE